MITRSGIIIGFLVFAIACTQKTAEQETTDAQTTDYSTFTIKRGTNIAHWLSQSNRRGEARATFFTEKDITYLDSVGFDHIRLPIDEVQMWDESGARLDSAFQLLEECLSW